MSEAEDGIRNSQVLALPPLGKLPALRLEMGVVRESESRIIEAKTVNPSTFSDLSHCYNEAYRILKTHLSSVGYQLVLANKALRTAQAEVILGAYAEHLKDKPRSCDSSHLRDAFLMKDKDYLEAVDRVGQLEALKSNFEGKIKVFENVQRYMSQKMYLISKSGVPYEHVGVTIGDKNGKSMA